MNRKSFLKTSLGSLAALSLPFNAQAAPISTGIKSEFAFGGEFKFGELSLYLHRPKSGITQLLHSIVGKDQEHDWSWCIVTPNTVGGRYPLKNLVSTVKFHRDQVSKNGEVLLIVDGVVEEELNELKRLLEDFPKLSIICSMNTAGKSNVSMTAIAMPDNIISFDLHPTPGAYTHLARRFKSRLSSDYSYQANFQREINFRQDESGFKVMSTSSFLV